MPSIPPRRYSSSKAGWRNACHLYFSALARFAARTAEHRHEPSAVQPLRVGVRYQGVCRSGSAVSKTSTLETVVMPLTARSPLRLRALWTIDINDCPESLRRNWNAARRQPRTGRIAALQQPVGRQQAADRLHAGRESKVAVVETEARGAKPRSLAVRSCRTCRKCVATLEPGLAETPYIRCSSLYETHKATNFILAVTSRLAVPESMLAEVCLTVLDHSRHRSSLPRLRPAPTGTNERSAASERTSK